MVARPWDWDTAFMLGHFGWRAVLAIVVSTRCYFLLFRRELPALASHAGDPDVEPDDTDAGRDRRCCRFRPGSPSCTSASWPGRSSTRTIRRCSSAGSCSSSASRARPRRIRAASSCKTPLLVGFFLAGLVIHGGLAGRGGLRRCCERLSETPLFLGATVLTAFNDNALITYLATLVPDLERRA